MMQPKRRNESFFGIHFDFHARRHTHMMGHELRPDIFAEMLDRVRPDYLQCDTKGHAGLSSYPTKVGNRAENMTVDPLRMLRDLTRERGIALYGHHSGIYDMKAACDHPDWAVVDADGTVSRDKMSVFGPYAKELLIPQLIELAVDYGLDGVWVDGECWAVQLDYSTHALAAWHEKTGREEAPRPNDPDFEEYREFCRQGFRDYVAGYIRAVKAVCPSFQAASNWLYSAQMPEKPTIPVDFISGDYDASDSYESARFHGRCMMHQGLSWDLMAWGQQAPCDWRTDDRNTKETVQYCQEAAAVLALGGGFQFFNPQYDGGCLVQKWAIPIWSQVAAFCRERQPFCFRGESRAETAIVLSRSANDDANRGLFGCGNAVSRRVNALVQLCADSQIPSDVLLSHHVLEHDLTRYGLIIVPDSPGMEEEVIDALRRYAENGGHLLLAGPDAARAFALPIGDTVPNRLTYIAQNGRMAAYQGRRADWLTDETPVTPVYDANYFESAAHAGSIAVSMGQGGAEALCYDLGDLYENNRTSVIRECFTAMADRLFPTRRLRVSGSMYADVTLTEKDGHIFVHLINSAGPHREANVRGYSEIPPIGPLTVRLTLPENPRSVVIQPNGRMAYRTYESGELIVTVPSLALYDIIDITP